MTPYLSEFFIALLFTIFVETILILFLLKKIYKQKDVGITKIINAGIFASTCTIPYVWFVFPFVFSQPTALLLSELFAFVAEAIFYRLFLKLSVKQSIVISLIANGASWSLGYLSH